jgi:hypothetical protein
MKTLFYLLIFFGFLIYIARPSLSFNPFSISFESPYLAFSLFFLMCAISFHGMHYEKDHKSDKEIEKLTYQEGYYSGKLDQIKESNLRLSKLHDTIQDFLKEKDK